MNDILLQLRRPYAFQDNFKHNLKSIGLIGMLTTLGLLYFQPLGINLLKENQGAYLAGLLGLTTFGVMLVNAITFPLFMPKIFSRRQWNLGKELLWYVWLCLLLAGVWSAVCHMSNNMAWTKIDIKHLLPVVPVPVVILAMFNYNRHIKSKVMEMLKHEPERVPPAKPESKKPVRIQIGADSSLDVLHIFAEHLIYCKAAGNYIEVCWNDGEVVRKQLVRSTLQSLKKQLAKVKFLKQSHRSWIVNTQKIRQISRFENNYLLQLKHIDTKVPVSRSHLSMYKAMLSNRLNRSSHQEYYSSQQA